ncbi:MAG TPA: FGGY-family carbohydrate kinase, partial [Bacteroidales bacterium]|nr:FGGY-family carbohydrate kinase [Bacteroidales bacterium]
VNKLIGNSELIDEKTKKQLIEEVEDKFIAALSEEAAKIPASESGIVALDWINGRRTPDANQALKGAIMGLSMGSDAPRVFRALVEAICFGSKKIVDRFEEEGVKIKNVVGLGGVAKKSTFVMQTMADVLDMPIKVAKSEQAPALGAAIYAAVASGIFPDVQQAKVAMGNGFDAEYYPQPERVKTYGKLYAEYNKLGEFIEKNTK